MEILFYFILMFRFGLKIVVRNVVNKIKQLKSLHLHRHQIVVYLKNMKHHLVSVKLKVQIFVLIIVHHHQYQVQMVEQVQIIRQHQQLHL